MHELMRSAFKERFPELAETGFGGLSVGDGWYWVLSGALAFLDQVRLRTGEPVNIPEIKEKFGGLRIYHGASMTGLEHEVFDLLTESVAKKTCDICGDPGWVANNDGWYAARCDKHRHTQFEKADQPQVDTIAKGLLTTRPVEGLLMPEGKTNFINADYQDEDGLFQIRRFRVETPELPNVSGQSLDEILVPVSDERMTKEDGRAILKAWNAEGVLTGALPSDLAWWSDENE